MPNTEGITTWEFGRPGGQGGDVFSDQISLRDMASVRKLTGVIVQCEGHIDAIGFVLSEESIDLTPFTLDPAWAGETAQWTDRRRLTFWA